MAIGVGLLTLAFSGIDFIKFADTVKEMNYWWILVALVCAFFSHLFRAARWNLLIGSLGYKTSLWTTFYSVMFGYLANTAVPRLGEVSRCGLLSKKENIPFPSLLGSVVSERLFDLIMLILLIAFTVLWEFEKFGGFLYDNAWLPLSEKLSLSTNTITLLFVTLLLSPVLFFFIYKMIRPKLIQYTFIAKTEAFVLNLAQGAKTIYKVKQKFLFFVYTIGVWLMYILMIYFPFFALTETSDLTFVDGLAVMAIGSIGMVVPAPGGIGAFHYFVIKLLTMIYGLNQEISASFAFVVHLAQTIFIIVLGAVSYFLIMFNKRPALNNGKNKSH